MNWVERLFLALVLLAAGAAGVLALSGIGVKIPLLDDDRVYDFSETEGNHGAALPPPLPEDEGLLAELGGRGGRWEDEPAAIPDSPPILAVDGEASPEASPTGSGTSASPGAEPEPARGNRDPIVDKLRAGLDPADAGQVLAFLIATTTERGTKLGEEDLDFLLVALSEHDDPGLRNLVFMHLERIGGERVTTEVLAFLEKEKNPWVQARALQTLRSQGDPRAVEGIVTFLANTKNGRLREAAFRNLLGTRSDTATQPLLDVLGGGAPLKTKAYALAALSQLGGERGARAVLAYAASSDPKERSLGLKSLRDLRNRAAVPVLTAALGDRGTPAFKREVVRTLGRTRDARAVPAVANLALYETDRGLRLEAVKTLGQIGRAQAIPALEVIAAQDKNKTVRQTAKRSIAVIDRAEAHRSQQEARRRR